MVNRSKINDPRFWVKWRASGAVGTIGKPLETHFINSNSRDKKSSNILLLCIELDALNKQVARQNGCELPKPSVGGGYRMYKRLTLEPIDELVQHESVTRVGETKIRTKIFNPWSMSVRTPEGNTHFDFSILGGIGDSNDFLWVFNQYLCKNGLYLAETEYSRAKLGGIIPHRLKGILYRQKEVQMSLNSKCETEF